MFVTSKVRTAKYVPHRKFVDMVTASCVIGAVSIAITGVGLNSIKKATPTEYIVKTGFGVQDVSLHKRTIVWPVLQTYSIIDISPVDYEFQLSAQSIEKIPFILPGFFTIGPKDDPESRAKYARLLCNKDIRHMILGILEGETRILSSTMTLEQIFNDRKKFKDIIVTGVQEELDQFGLMVYNANIKEMRDGEQSQYFHNMMQKKESEVANVAKIDIAEATKKGDIGAKEREAETRQKNSGLEATTIRTENDNKKDIQKSNAELAVTTAEALQVSTIAQIESVSNSNIRKHEMELTVQEKKQQAEIAAARATKLAQTIVEAEMIRMRADAALYAKEQEANGIKAVYQAQADGLQNITHSFGNNHSAMLQFLMLEKGQYEKIAEANAKAFNGLNPKITMFNANSESSNSNPIGDIFKMLPMYLMTLNEQLGFSKTNEKTLPMLSEPSKESTKSVVDKKDSKKE